MRVAGLSRADVAQEARCIILESQARGITDEHELYNLARNHLHKLRRRKTETTLDVDIADDARQVFECLDAFYGLLNSARNNLTDTQCTILVLTYLDGMADADIAERLGVKVRTVQARRSAALQRLRKCSEENFQKS